MQVLEVEVEVQVEVQVEVEGARVSVRRPASQARRKEREKLDGSHSHNVVFIMRSLQDALQPTEQT